MKKLCLTFIAFVLVLTMPLASAHAGSYDHIGTRETNKWSDYYGMWKTSTISSGGGYLKVLVDYGARYYVYEYDPGSNKNEYLGAWYADANTTFELHVEGYVDGSNNRAEIYVVSSAYDVLLNFWD
ncbi:hypothetical protein [Thalassobacillus pellis]|uniref:hypothetical protein n=1 Tax=Thalassobacillus pellis TaxID=748008 RepID=UPI001EF85B2A|nr:hypothetical protein [Thalassobacillus pellis]MBM7551631.1 hypothetical protein [Thalassobacillus pellis]